MQRACSGSFMYGELTDKSTIGKHVKKTYKLRAFFIGYFCFLMDIKYLFLRLYLSLI